MSLLVLDYLDILLLEKYLKIRIIMRYSLLSQFQGALLGGAIGDALTGCEPLSNIFPEHQQPDWYNILNYQPSEYSNKLKQVCLMVSESRALEQQIKQQQPSNSGEWAYISFPIILFYHENNSLLRQEIKRFAHYWQWSAEILADVLLWSYIVTLILKVKLDNQNIIRQLLGGVRAKTTPLWEMLTELESWLSEDSSLERVVEKLSSQAQEYSLALSLYCFSSTPENFELAVSRAGCYQAKAKMAARLTGILAGGHNGVVGIPTAWRKLSSQNPEYQKITQLGTILLHNWSGVYLKGENSILSQIKPKVIAAPGTIQTRSSLTVISQQE